MKIAYCGFDFFISCLDVIFEYDHTVLKIFSRECDNKYDFNVEVEKRAKQHNIDFTTKKITEADIKKLMKDGCELIIVAAYPYRIPVFEGMPRVINIHPSLLPEGRGPWPLPWIILNNLSKSGTTIHKIDKDFDTGDILAQGEFSVSKEDNLETISAKSQMVAEKLLRDLLKDIDNRWNSAIKQLLGSYWKMPTLTERTLDWNKSIDEINKVVRAFGKFESYAKFDGKDWLIRNAICWKEKHDMVPGSVACRMNKEIVIAAKDGFTCVRDYVSDDS